MGYHTQFEGSFAITPPVSKGDMALYTDNQKFLSKETQAASEEARRNETWHMVPAHEVCTRWPNPPNENYCGWKISKSGKALAWDGLEKFRDWLEWLEYLVANFFAPKGYKLNGLLMYQGDAIGDAGLIELKDNLVEVNQVLYVYRERRRKTKAMAKVTA